MLSTLGLALQMSMRCVYSCGSLCLVSCSLAELSKARSFGRVMAVLSGWAEAVACYVYQDRTIASTIHASLSNRTRLAHQR